METETPTLKIRKKREMTPELLDKLKHARERAAELRNSVKETKSKLPDTIPEKEKTKVAQYLTTRKAIKEKIKQEIINEIEEAPLKDPNFKILCDVS
jgi:DNA repair ATPase RecN